MTRALEEARRQLQAGRPDEAERLLRRELEISPNHVGLRTALAQTLSATGRKDAALAELTALVAAAPADRMARLLLARHANEAGRAELAAEHAEFLTRADPRDSEAWSALGFAAHAQGRRRAARTALQRAVELAPAYAAAHRNLAAVLCDEELSEEALESAATAARHGAAGAALERTRARALIQLDRVDEADGLLRALLGANPDDAQGHSLFAQLRQLRGDADPLHELRAAARRAGAAPAVRLAFGDALRRMGEAGQAREELQALIAQLGPAPTLLGALATILQELGDMGEACRLARDALAGAPQDLAIAETFIATAIAGGAAGEALPHIERLRAAHPHDQRWTTYRIDAARLGIGPAIDAWFDPAIVTRVYELPPPPGFRDTDEFHAALVDIIGARHRQKAHPLGQSLRSGTQTSRNLLIRPEPAVALLLDSFRAALAEYRGDVARSVAARGEDARMHPLLARGEARPELVGCWSVRLRRGGFHVNHIHPEGWVSSAFYLSVPAESSDTARRAGWLKFGEPRFPVAGLAPLAFVQPQPGRLALFPSYLWHGTNPLAGDEPRLTVAFDAVPEEEMQ